MKRTFIKKISLTLIMLLMLTSAVFATVPEDVVGKPYESAVQALMDKNIITGDQDGLFHPNNTLTRVQACVIVVKSMDPPATAVTGTPSQPVQKSGFSDMKGYGWAEGYVNYAVKSGITKGYGNGKFGPGDMVSADQLATMILRAAGYTDNALSGTWPLNYTSKGEETGLYNEIPASDRRVAKAPRWLAAQMAYNMLEDIVAADVKPENELPSNKPTEGGNEVVPGLTKMAYGSGSFNATITTYAGKEIAQNVTVYTYGLKKDYKEGMVFSDKKDEFRADTIHKYKNASTPCFYSMSGGKIVSMVIPMDAGFSGNVYGVINGVSSVLNGDKEGVNLYDTLAAGRPISWLSQKSLGAPAEYLDGTIFEMTTSNGEIKSISKAGQTTVNGKHFKELTATSFEKIKSYKGSVVELEDGNMFTIKGNVAVYILADDQKSYRVGSQSNISDSYKIRGYDITNDSDESADLIVLSK